MRIDSPGGLGARIPVVDPEKENPTIVEAIVRAGGRVQYVSVLGSTLEDAYLKLVREPQ